MKSLKGIGLAGISACFNTLSSALVTYTKNIDAVSKTFFVLLLVALFSVPILVERGINPFREFNWLLNLKSFLSSNATLAFFYAFPRLPLADACTISATAPIFASLFAWIFLGEPVSRQNISGLLVVFLGITCIIKPPFLFGITLPEADHPEYLFGAIVMIMATIMQSSLFILLRKLKDLHYSEIMFNMGLISAVQSGTFLLITQGEIELPRSKVDIGLIFMTSVMSFAAHTCLTISLHNESAVLVSMIRKAGEVLFAFILQVTVFGDHPKLLSFIGAALIVMVIVLTGISKMEEEKTNHDNDRDKIRAILQKSPLEDTFR